MRLPPAPPVADAVAATYSLAEAGAAQALSETGHVQGKILVTIP